MLENVKSEASIYHDKLLALHLCTDDSAASCVKKITTSLVGTSSFYLIRHWRQILNIGAPSMRLKYVWHAKSATDDDAFPL